MHQRVTSRHKTNSNITLQIKRIKQHDLQRCFGTKFIYVHFRGREVEKEEEDDDDEMKNLIGLVGVINHDENKIIDLHLDSKTRIDFFGQHTSKEQQLNMINFVLVLP